MTKNKIHEKAYQFMEAYRAKHPDFYYWLRMKDRKPKDGGLSRFDKGMWFQGNESYAFVGLYDRSGGSNMTRSIGLVFNGTNEKRTGYLELAYNEEKDSKVLVFYQEFLELVGGFKKTGKTVYRKDFEEKDFFKAATIFLEEVKPEIDALARKMEVEHLFIEPDKFNKLHGRILELRNKSSMDGEITSRTAKYWLYAPGARASEWNKFYEEGIMALGWDKLGDLRQYENKELIAEKLQKLQRTKKSKENDSTANYEFVNSVSVGDMVVSVVKNETNTLLGLGKVKSEYYFDEERLSFKSCRKVDWIKRGAWDTDFKLPTKKLTDVSADPGYNTYLGIFLSMINGDKNNTNRMIDPLNQILYGPPGTGKTYHTINKTLAIIEGKSEADLAGEERVDLKERFQEYIDEGQIVFTTFHQSMSYEDFVEGIKPETVDRSVVYETKSGIFKELCGKASSNFENSKSDNQEKLPFEVAFEKLKEEWEEDTEMKFPLKTANYDYTILEFTNTSIRFKKASGGTGHTLSINTLKELYYGKVINFNGGVGIYYPSILDKLRSYDSEEPEGVQLKNYVLIIDEINRGNVSQIFGELITLIEEDKRQGEPEALEVTLPYSKESFSVPSNLYIIGTMNTADRSVEALDTALRRRFSFKEMPPRYDLKQLAYEVFGFKISEILKTINQRIEKLLDKDHMIGHSNFILRSEANKETKVRTVFYKKIIPQLQEYFFGDFGKIGLVLGEGFVQKQEDFKEIGFAKFGYDDVADFEDREIYEIIDHSEEEDMTHFEQAIHVLMNK